MALIKNYDTQYRVSASYWKINYVSIDSRRNQVTFTMDLYKDKADSNNEPLETFPVSDFIFMTDEELRKQEFEKYFKNIGADNIYKACYTFAKEKVTFFLDAVDDPEEMALNHPNKVVGNKY